MNVNKLIFTSVRISFFFYFLNFFASTFEYICFSAQKKCEHVQQHRFAFTNIFLSAISLGQKTRKHQVNHLACQVEFLYFLLVDKTKKGDSAAMHLIRMLRFRYTLFSAQLPMHINTQSLFPVILQYGIPPYSKHLHVCWVLANAHVDNSSIFNANAYCLFFEFAYSSATNFSLNKITNRH